MSEDFSGREPGNMSVWNTFTSKRNDIAEEEEASGDSDGEDRRRNRYRNPLKASFSSAFQSIIGKKLDEEAVDAAPILSKYKKPAKEASEELKREQQEKAKRLEKEKLRLMGRHLPSAVDEERERELQIIATRGGTPYSIYPGMSYIMYSCAAIQHCS